jgi:hypothetical protein
MGLWITGKDFHKMPLVKKMKEFQIFQMARVSQHASVGIGKIRTNRGAQYFTDTRFYNTKV